MKTALFPLLFLLGLTMSGCNQTAATTEAHLRSIDSSLCVIRKWNEQVELYAAHEQRYKLYPTENIYTFLQLDTKTGKIKQVQWSLKSVQEFSVIINDEDLRNGANYGSNTFELYPTKNMYQFILLNKCSGRKWHIQWGIESENRWIREFYEF